jgi:hypothetical protein
MDGWMDGWQMDDGGQVRDREGRETRGEPRERPGDQGRDQGELLISFFSFFSSLLCCSSDGAVGVHPTGRWASIVAIVSIVSIVSHRRPAAPARNLVPNVASGMATVATVAPAPPPIVDTHPMPPTIAVQRSSFDELSGAGHGERASNDAHWGAHFWVTLSDPQVDLSVISA